VKRQAQSAADTASSFDFTLVIENIEGRRLLKRKEALQKKAGSSEESGLFRRKQAL
jgi:hypothetical protein